MVGASIGRGQDMSDEQTPIESVKHDDRRFTIGLLVDLFEVLERHGYQKKLDAPGHASVAVALLKIVRIFEGADE